MFFAFETIPTGFQSTIKNRKTQHPQVQELRRAPPTFAVVTPCLQTGGVWSYNVGESLNGSRANKKMGRL